MRRPIEEHLKHAWLVSTLAPDFELLDVWRYPIQIDEQIPLERFIDFVQSSQRELASNRGAAGALFRLRAVLGRVFGWDDDEMNPSPALPIPGCQETSIRDRLTDADRKSESEQRDPAGESSNEMASSFKPVYQRENESLLEISNKTVHAMMHLGRVPVSATKWSPQMGVYVKPRGRLGGFYMALIAPFRHYIVYPAMMKAAKEGWPRYAKAHGLIAQ